MNDVTKITIDNSVRYVIKDENLPNEEVPQTSSRRKKNVSRKQIPKTIKKSLKI